MLITAVLFYLDQQGIFPWALLACALHEWGHYAAIWLVGGQVVRLRLTAVGGEMQLSSRNVLSYGQELTAVLAGPAVNFGIAFLTSMLAKKDVDSAFLFAGLNLSIGCFNLLPAYPLDGGRAIYILVSMLWSPEAAQRVTHLLACVTALVMLAVGAALLWKTGYNFALLMVSFWMLTSMLRTQNYG